MSSTPTSTRLTAKRSGLIISAGLLAGALALGGTVAANAASPATVTSSSSTATANAQLTVTADGFAPNESLALTLDGSTALDTYAAAPFTTNFADASGHYVATAYLPRTLALGAHTITVTGVTTGAVSTPVTIVASPSGSVTPATVALSAYLSKGVTVTFSGFTPGDTVTFGLGDQGSGGTVGSPVTVGASGVATLTYMPTAGAHFSTVGTYTFGASAGDGSIVAQFATLTVTADPSTPAPAAPVAAPAVPVKQAASFTG